MGKIYKGQTDLTIRLETGKDLTGISDTKIGYRKPTGVTGYFEAEIVDIEKGIIEYNVESVNDINVSETWVFWAKIVNIDGLISIGESVALEVYEQGK